MKEFHKLVFLWFMLALLCISATYSVAQSSPPTLINNSAKDSFYISLGLFLGGIALSIGITWKVSKIYEKLNSLQHEISEFKRTCPRYNSLTKSCNYKENEI